MYKYTKNVNIVITYIYTCIVENKKCLSVTLHVLRIICKELHVQHAHCTDRVAMHSLNVTQVEKRVNELNPGFQVENCHSKRSVSVISQSKLNKGLILQSQNQ